MLCIDSISGGRVVGRASKDNIVNENGEIIGSAGGRMKILKMSFEAFKSKPLLGTGPDTLGERFQLDFDSELGEYITVHNAYPDKAHNEYLEYAASCGIFTLIAYILLIGCIFKGLIKNINDDRAKIMIISLIGYLVQGFFNISVIMVAPLYWIMLGVFVKFINDDFKNYSISRELIR